MVKEPDTQRSLFQEVGLVGITLASLIFGSFGVSGCGNVQVGSSIPKLPSRDNPFYSLVKKQYDSEMDKARALRAENYRIDKLVALSNDSVPGYSGWEPSP